MNRARAYRCTRMRRWVERSNDTEPLWLRPFCRGCITATLGYDFRKGQVIKCGSRNFKLLASLHFAADSQKINKQNNPIAGANMGKMTRRELMTCLLYTSPSPRD